MGVHLRLRNQCMAWLITDEAILEIGVCFNDSIATFDSVERDFFESGRNRFDHPKAATTAAGPISAAPWLQKFTNSAHAAATAWTEVGKLYPLSCI